MKKHILTKHTGYTYTSLSFPVRPTALPTVPQLSDIVARIGVPGQEQVILCENLEEVQILWDLNASGDLPHLVWGILQKN